MKKLLNIAIISLLAIYGCNPPDDSDLIVYSIITDADSVKVTYMTDKAGSKSTYILTSDKLHWYAGRWESNTYEFFSGMEAYIQVTPLSNHGLDVSILENEGAGRRRHLQRQQTINPETITLTYRVQK